MAETRTNTDPQRQEFCDPPGKSLKLHCSWGTHCTEVATHYVQTSYKSNALTCPKHLAQTRSKAKEMASIAHGAVLISELE